MKRVSTVAVSCVFALAGLASSCDALLGGEPDGTPTALFDSMWSDFADTYALFAVKGVDWNAAYAAYRPRVRDDMGDAELFAVMGDLLSLLQDGHVYLMTPFACMNSDGANTEPDPFSLALVRERYLTDVEEAGGGIFTYGRLSGDPATGYVHVKAFSLGRTGLDQTQDWAFAVDEALAALRDTDRLVLDVRGNRGGLTGNVSTVAGRFAAQGAVYALSRTKDGPGPDDFGAAVPLELAPSGPYRYEKPIVLLTNKETMSAGEEFVMALKTQPHVTQVGGATNGVFSLSLQRTLVNGWKYSVSVQKVVDPDGVCYEDAGMAPADDMRAVNTAAEIGAGTDTQLEKAVAVASAYRP